MCHAAGDVIRVHTHVRCVVFATTHRVASQGYALIRDKSKGLKVGSICHTAFDTFNH